MTFLIIAGVIAEVALLLYFRVPQRVENWTYTQTMKLFRKD